MKYPEHITEFWRVRTLDSSLTNTDFTLYSYLCNCLNQGFWQTDTITQRQDLTCGQLCINAKTLTDSRNRLKQKGFIDFKTETITNKNGKKQGVKGASTTYIILNSLPNSLPNGRLNGVERESKGSLNDHVLLNKIEMEKEIDIPDDFKNLTQEEIGKWKKFQNWFAEQGFKSLPKIRNQLTPKEFLRLTDEFGGAAVADILGAIENRNGCEKKYTSVYRTAHAWLKKDSKAN